MHDKATREEVETQLVEDLKIFSSQVEQYVYVPLNRSRKGAVLSFAHSIGLLAFKNSRLLELINRHASKTEIIKEWSPYINRYWLSGGDGMRDRRRAELDLSLCRQKDSNFHKTQVPYSRLPPKPSRYLHRSTESS